MNTKLRFRMMAVMLLMLIAGNLPTWAYDHEETFEDSNSKDCILRYNDGSYPLGTPDEFKGFETLTNLDNANGSYYWKWRVQYYKQKLISVYVTKKISTEGTLSVVLKNGDVCDLFIFKTTYGSNSSISIDIKDSDGGEYAVDEISNEDVTISYKPANSYVNEIEKVIIRIDKCNIEYREIGDLFGFNTLNCTYEPYEYEKSVGSAYTPLPQPSFAWNDNGEIVAQINNAVNGLDHSDCLSQKYYFKYGAINMSGVAMEGGESGFVFSNNSVIKSQDKKTLSASHTIRNNDWAAYTSPLHFSTNDSIQIRCLSNNKNCSVVWTHKQQDVIVDPYTSPYSLSTEYEQWTKNVTVSWKAVEERLVYPHNPYRVTFLGRKPFFIDNADCRKDGKWYVLRYA